MAEALDSLESTTRKRESILDKKDEAPQLRDEIGRQVQIQQPLYLAMITGCAVLLYQAFQSNASPLTACLVPLIGLSLALKISVHDLRSGQIGFYQRKILRSPWEIVRRRLWDASKLSHIEKHILDEQHIEITPELAHEAQKLLPLIPHADDWANRIMFASFEGTAVTILLIRTYHQFFDKDLVAIFAWILAGGATLASLLILQRKRVR